MAGAVPLIPRLRFNDALGNPLALGWVTVYLAGTTTLATTYQDMGLAVPNTNPVHLDANGESLFYVDPTQRYKLLLQNAALVTVSGWPVDNVLSGGNTPGTLINVQTFTATGTYTPTPGTTFIVVELVGGGGAGGGTLATAAGQIAAGAGGNGGGYSKSRLATGFAGVTVTVGGGGVASLGSVGGNGSTTAFGSVFSATGGQGGAAGNVSLSSITTFTAPSAGLGVGSGGNIVNATGQAGLPGLYTDAGSALGGSGGSSVLSGGGVGLITNNGSASPGYGGGGSGAASNASTSARIGGNGGNGVCIIWEYA